MKKLTVVKIGGNIIDDADKLADFLLAFSAIEGAKILVHGGGKLATRVAEAMGIRQQLIDGRRITDGETLKVVTMVYAGYINKNIVARLQAHECNAIGLSGADAGYITAHKRQHPSIDYGFVGDIDAVNGQALNNFITSGYTPVLSPITHDTKGQLLNTNADTIAQETAKALSVFYEVSLIYCFEKKGVLLSAEEGDNYISALSFTEFKKLSAASVITAGMIPKLENAFKALQAGVQHISIGHAGDLSKLISGQAGTNIIHE